MSRAKGRRIMRKKQEKKNKAIFCSSWEQLFEEQLEDATPKYCGIDNSGVGWGANFVPTTNIVNTSHFAIIFQTRRILQSTHFIRDIRPRFLALFSQRICTKNAKRNHFIFPMETGHGKRFLKFLTSFPNIFPRNILLLQHGHN